MKLLLDYIALCFFINNPNDLEPSKSFVWKCIAFYLISGSIVEGLISDPADGSLEVAMRAIVAVTLIVLMVVVLKQWPRFIQLLTAIFMCENFIMTLGIATEVLDHYLQRTPYENIPLYIGGLLILWYIAILGYIIRQMFEYNLLASLILAFWYFGLAYGLPFLVMEVL
ncbi:MAG: hypothetical protein HOP02_17550 [Methylococcaceae bacterium]|nr:hypothetical protein [Methylococcaceae bacterium]